MILQPYQRDRIATDTTYQQAKAVIERNGENLETVLAELQAVVPGVYGGMSYDGAAVPLTATTTPQEITAFDTARPSRGVIVDPAADTLQPDASGVYLVSAQFSAEISSGTGYVLELFVNGVESSLKSAVDASNQTSFIFIGINGLRSIPTASLELDMRISTDSGTGAFNVANAEFSVTRVGL